MAALVMTLAPGWKTYWRAPGETGIAPAFDWSGSANLAGVRLHWPRPVAIGGGLGASIGYEGRLVLPIEVVPARPGERVRLAAEVALGVCADLCVPVTLGLAADLAPPGRREPRIAAALADRPLAAAEAGVRGFSCRIEAAAGGGLRVAAEVLLPLAGEVRAAAFETGDAGLWVSSARLAQGAGAVRASADILPAAPGPVALDRSALRLTLVGDDTAVELRGCPAG
ncbi:MAG: hypothetical protein IT545_15625 [Rhodobacteraceae bacterium]|nr:hypothetical protein [Paracoccaceae bacterium]